MWVPDPVPYPCPTGWISHPEQWGRHWAANISQERIHLGYTTNRECSDQGVDPETCLPLTWRVLPREGADTIPPQYSKTYKPIESLPQVNGEGSPITSPLSCAFPYPKLMNGYPPYMSWDGSIRVSFMFRTSE